MTVRLAARVLVIRERPTEQFLLVRVANPSAPLGYVWTPPGGKLEAGESTRCAAARELWEEVQVRVDRESLTWLCDFETHFDFRGETLRQVDVVYWVPEQLTTGPPTMVGQEIAEMRWFANDQGGLEPISIVPPGLIAELRRRNRKAGPADDVQ